MSDMTPVSMTHLELATVLREVAACIEAGASAEGWVLYQASVIADDDLLVRGLLQVQGTSVVLGKLNVSPDETSGETRIRAGLRMQIGEPPPGGA